MPPADRATGLRVAGTTPAAAAVQAAEALDVDRHQLARLADVEAAEAAPRLREQMRQPVRAVPAQDPVHRARVEAKVRTDEVGAPAQLETQPEHARLDRVRGASRRAVGPRAAIAVCALAAAPAVHRPPACAVVLGGADDAEPQGLAHQERASARGEARGTVHRSLRLAVFGLDTAHPSPCCPRSRYTLRAPCEEARPRAFSTH